MTLRSQDVPEHFKLTPTARATWVAQKQCEELTPRVQASVCAQLPQRTGTGDKTLAADRDRRCHARRAPCQGLMRAVTSTAHGNTCRFRRRPTKSIRLRSSLFLAASGLTSSWRSCRGVPPTHASADGSLWRQRSREAFHMQRTAWERGAAPRGNGPEEARVRPVARLIKGCAA